jgi:signal transduction histidine kinase
LNLGRAAEIGLGASVIGILLMEGWRIWQLQATRALPLEQTRVRNLLGLMALPILVSGIEAIGRIPTNPLEPNLDLLLRAVKVQGVLPPVGAVLSSATVYVLAHAVERQRMLDMDELLLDLSRVMARIGTVGAAAATLGAVTLIQLGSQLPGHSSFQALLAASLGLLAIDPVREHAVARMLELLDSRGQRLREGLQRIEGALARVISMEGLGEELLGKLIRTGRVSAAALYLIDSDRGAYQKMVDRGRTGAEPLSSVPVQPLTGALVRYGAFVRTELLRDAARLPAKKEEILGVVRVMEGMAADAVIPLRSGETVLGWLTLSDGDGGGFSEEELHRIRAVTDRAAVILENLHDFERIKEVHRLAALGTMAAGLAHEIRNPLAGIKGAAQYLQAEARPEDREMIQIIVDEVDRLNTVVTQFLDYARPLSLVIEPVRIDTLLAQISSLFRAQGTQGIRWVEDLSPELLQIHADAPRLKQVLLNLCQNALQAMKSGGSLTVRTRPGFLRNASGTPALELSVEDTGCGIESQDFDKLFVPFYTTRTDGTGLGLPICQRIIQSHGGEIEVHSTPGKGTTFLIRLPAVYSAG